MKNLKTIDELNERLTGGIRDTEESDRDYIKQKRQREHEKSESIIYEQLEEACLRVLQRGLNIDPKLVKEVESFNKYILIHTTNGEKVRIDMSTKFV